MPLVGFLMDTTLATAHLIYAGVPERFPRIRWVLCHTEAQFRFSPSGSTEASRRSPGVGPISHVCRASISGISTTIRSTSNPACLRLALDFAGAGRVVAGSDYPHMIGSLEKMKSSISALGLSTETRRGSPAATRGHCSVSSVSETMTPRAPVRESANRPGLAGDCRVWPRRPPRPHRVLGLRRRGRSVARCRGAGCCPRSAAAVIDEDDARGAGPSGIRFLRQGLTSPDVGLQALSVRAFGRQEDPDQILRIAPRLSSSDAEVRSEAANALGQAVFRTDGDDVADLLFDHLTREADPDVKASWRAPWGA